MNNESVSPTSSNPISVLPASFDKIEAGVRSCKAYLIRKENGNEGRRRIRKVDNLKSLEKKTHLNEVLTPSSANLSKASSLTANPSTLALNDNTVLISSRL